jgi:hypothetical protein
MVMTEGAEQVPPESRVPLEGNVDKTVEVAKIIFHVATPLTVVELSDGRRVLRETGADQPQNVIETKNMVEALTEAMKGLVLDTAGKEFGVVLVRMQAGGSIEIVAIIVATYLVLNRSCCNSL